MPTRSTSAPVSRPILDLTAAEIEDLSQKIADGPTGQIIERRKHPIMVSGISESPISNGYLVVPTMLGGWVVRDASFLRTPHNEPTELMAFSNSVDLLEWLIAEHGILKTRERPERSNHELEIKKVRTSYQDGPQEQIERLLLMLREIDVQPHEMDKPVEDVG